MHKVISHGPSRVVRRQPEAVEEQLRGWLRKKFKVVLALAGPRGLEIAATWIKHKHTISTSVIGYWVRYTMGTSRVLYRPPEKGYMRLYAGGVYRVLALLLETLCLYVRAPSGCGG